MIYTILTLVIIALAFVAVTLYNDIKSLKYRIEVGKAQYMELAQDLNDTYNKLKKAKEELVSNAQEIADLQLALTKGEKTEAISRMKNTKEEKEGE